MSFGLILVSCLIISAFFSALETSLNSLSVARIKKLMEEGALASRSLQLWLNKPNHVLTTILVGNNIANTLAAAMATVLAQAYFASFAISIATFFITLMILIFGEITPKTFGRHNAEKFAPIGMFFLVPIYFFFLPLSYALSFLAAKMVRLGGTKAIKLGPSATEEDIAYMIRLGHEEGVLRRTEGQLLQSVIEFRETIAKEVMVTRTEIQSFDVNANYEEVVSRIIKDGHTRWPVYEKNIDNIIGIFHVKDLLNTIEKVPKNFSLRKYLRPAKFVPEMMKIGSLLKEFQAGKAHLAIVVDEYGGTAGIISLEDILEEIVGDIRDEYDDEEVERTLHQIDAENYLASGRLNISQLGKSLNVLFPDSDAYDSLGGFLIATHGSLPKVGTKIIFDDLIFLIKAADEKKIIQVHIHHAQGQSSNNILLNNTDELRERVAA